jgi:pimeloyl-ACP methyl ester carboxylesterase
MQTRCLVIGGTFAPWLCEYFYYDKILQIPQEIGITTEFTSIQTLGLGNIMDSVYTISRKYFEGHEDNFILIGHSQGAIIANLLAMQYSDRVLAVIALAGPYMGTIWTDPQTMVVKIAIEGIHQMSRGNIQLKPHLSKSRLSKLTGRLIPVVRHLSNDSEVLLLVKKYLEYQEYGPYTYSIIGTDDRFVLPSRSAHPSGPRVKKYLAAHPHMHHYLLGRIPEEIELLAFKAGHIGIVHDPSVLALVKEIITSQVLSTSSSM